MEKEIILYIPMLKYHKMNKFDKYVMMNRKNNTYFDKIIEEGDLSKENFNKEQKVKYVNKKHKLNMLFT